MDSTTGLPGKQPLGDTALAASSNQRVAHTRAIVGYTLWVIGFVLLMVAAVIVHSHPGPYPIDLQTTITLQHLQVWSVVSTPIYLASIVDDPIPIIVSYVLWFIVLMLIGVFVRSRGAWPMRWFVTAIFISIGAAVAAGLDWIISTWVGRPRPASPLIHVYLPEPTKSFPSGHVENDVVYFGFLLYLSLTKPVSEWRYRWILIPFQLFAVLNILLVGYSRVYEGSHWLTDASAGYLAGALWLSALIFLYRWTINTLTERRARRLLEQSPQAQQA